MRITLLAAGTLSACLAIPHAALAADKETLKRGEYLAAVGGCNDCHTPMKMGSKGPEPDMSRQLSGHPAEFKVGPAPALGNGSWMWAGSATNTAFAGPWGITYAVNLTSDKETGLGGWKPDDFVKALKNGKHAGVGRPILPPMPWQGYSKMTEGDLKALFAYLQSVPAIKNRAPEYQPPAAK